MRRFLVTLCLLLLGARRGALAQAGPATEGAVDFLRGIGARSIAMGLTTTAAATGSEAVWWNPALIARSTREVSIHSRTQASAGDPDSDIGIAAVVPVQRVGTFAVTLRYLNNGQQDVVTPSGAPVGTFNNVTFVLGATFATTFGDRLAVGITAKQLILNLSCSGDCTQPNTPDVNQAGVTALDFGGHLFVTNDSTLSLGVSVLHLGRKFQIIDSPQADPLPTRGSLGVLYAPKTPDWPGVRVRVGADVVTRITDGTSLGFRVGGEVSYQETFQFRAGYMKSGPGDIDSPTLGVGLAKGKFQFDFSQMMTDFGGQGRPTFVSFRYRF